MARIKSKRRDLNDLLAPVLPGASPWPQQNLAPRKRAPFSFVLDDLAVLDPVVKTMFGFYYVYVSERLVLMLRDRNNQSHFNGVWIATTSEHLRSLSEEFASLPTRCLIDSGKNAWIFLPAIHDSFEALALRVCDLIKEHDYRIGGTTRFFSARRHPNS